ncbi:exodeoxyribonuclease V subunit gamma [Rhodococcus sp. ABRD24]|uniref:exodeoxyribonuclease V subunit gamma n=1 Tax=Rhodococcus sp. ABRD24 TaxID=2507582 RepID=UPI001038675C|nr:exodeoxyribonuclease V subunit gamma [Rhodococcus sp. ABRD24]QBJ97880.1 exodeoxyribonuclease V subunit gamma [Rhodococcus sp. ABRD24]
MLTLHRAQGAGTLASALADVLVAPLTDPFRREVVAVPAKGVERWLTQRLSRILGAGDRGAYGDGVAANIDFPSPTRLVDEVLAAATGLDAENDPWHPSRMLWTLLDVIDGCLDEPWCVVLARHLGRGVDAHTAGDHRVGRRYGTAAHLAELFRSYGAQRPAMLVDWAAGRDTDGADPLDEDLLWQPQLWRRLRERIGTLSPAERLDGACARLRTEPGLVDLPERLSLFGPTRLGADQIAVLSALASNRDVHVWIPHPSLEMWGSSADAAAPIRRADDHRALSASHPLLASLARDVRELQSRLSAVDLVDIHHPAPPRPSTLLGRLQSDIAADRAPSAWTFDDTVEIHSCHGPARQVEALRERLLHLFQDDPTLEPRDVLVVCPDVESYAPLVRAAFGQGAPSQPSYPGHLGHPGHRLRVRLADRALHQTNPVLAVVGTLLEMSDARVTVSQVLDLAATAPVRRRFTFDDDNLERMREWIAAAGARWGIGPRERRAYGLGDFEQNTLRAALDRILLGTAADDADGEWLSLALPLDDVESNDIDFAGRLAEFVDRLDVSLRGLTGPQSAGEWSKALARALDLLVDVPETDAWQLGQAHRELAAAVEHAGDTHLRLSDVRAMLRSRLAGRPTRANFRTGELTVCTMVPMRSVPHRVVVLLGLDDDVFPRGTNIDGDDVLARDPLVGERDPRSEDRQLLLDAIMSADERLLLFYTGADPVNGTPRPPAVPLSELRDVLATMVGSDAVVTRHALQPFDPRNFDPDQPVSFDRSALAGAQAAQRPSVPQAPFLPAPLAPVQPGDVDLAELIAFLENPVQGFLRQRLGFRVPDLDEDTADALDLELDPLARWGIGDRMLAARLAGTDPAAFRAAEWRRGTLPPAKLGATVLADIEWTVESLVRAAAPVHAGRPEAVDVDIDLGLGRRLVGTVDGIYRDVLARTTFSRLAPKHRIGAWVRLLAVAASGGAANLTAVTTGRGSGRVLVARSTLAAPENAAEVLARLVQMRDRGLEAPLPMSPGASSAYADQRFRGRSIELALVAAERAWDKGFDDSLDRHIQFVHGVGASLSGLIDNDAPPGSHEPSRFGAEATALWYPLLAAETLGEP